MQSPSRLRFWALCLVIARTPTGKRAPPERGNDYGSPMGRLHPLPGARLLSVFPKPFPHFDARTSPCAPAPMAATQTRTIEYRRSRNRPEPLIRTFAISARTPKKRAELRSGASACNFHGGFLSPHSLRQFRQNRLGRSLAPWSFCWARAERQPGAFFGRPAPKRLRP